MAARLDSADGNRAHRSDSGIGASVTAVAGSTALLYNRPGVATNQSGNFTSELHIENLRTLPRFVRRQRLYCRTPSGRAGS